MAYDRYDSRDEQRGYRDDRQREHGSGERDQRGFFERAREEVSSWFGDESSGSHREHDARMSHPESSRRYENQSDNHRRGYEDRYSGSNRGFEPRAYDQDDSRSRYGRDEGSSGRSAFFGSGGSSRFSHDEDDRQRRSQYGQGGSSSSFGRQGDDFQSRQGQGQSQGRSYPSGYGQTGGGSYRDTQHQSYGYDRDREQQSHGYQSQGSDQYRPMTGDYGRGSNDRGRQGSGFGGQDFGQQQYGSQDRFQDQDRSYGQRSFGDRDQGRESPMRDDARAAFGGSSSSSFGRSAHDDHYHSWRQRQIEDLDRDYDEYRREHQSRFENEFSSFRQQRQTKREMLRSIREHFEVVDESGQRIGTVDKVHGDKIILTKNDPEAGGVHRSFTCSLLERVEDNKVYLTGSKDSIRSRLQEERSNDDDRSRGGGGGILGGLFGGSDDDRRDDRSSASSAATTTGSSTTASSSGQTGDGPHVLDQSFSGTYDESSSTKR